MNELTIVDATGIPKATHEIYKIVDEYDESLTNATVAWDFTNPPADIKYISMSLIATMLNHHGIGLAANQCRLPYRIFVMGAMGENQQYVETVVNPVILKHEGEDIDSEGCLSFPGVYLNIKRAAAISVKYYTLDGREQNKVFSGLTARVFQHEYDHLNGAKFTSYVSSFEYQRAKGKAKANLRRQKKIIQQAARDLKQQQRVKKTVEQSTVLTYSTDTAQALTLESGSESLNLVIST
jgi:peptide deformylase